MNQQLESRPFGPDFWFTYIANSLLMVAVSALFRYADFVTVLGGSEYELGWIVGIGMVGALAMRFLQGIGIDRYGAGTVWVISLVFTSVSLLAHLWIHTLASPAAYLARIVYTSSLAGSFGASITFVSASAPKHRTGEMIGALGSSGFVGIALGPVVADWLFSLDGTQRACVDRLFVCGAAMSGLAIFFAFAAIRCGEPRKVFRRRVPIVGVLRRYHPGSILMVGVAMGVGLGIPFCFLRPFAAELNIEGIRGFFLVYAVVAFVTRVSCRRLPDLWGVRKTVLLGLGCLAASMLSYLFVWDRWTMMLPAALGGLAHSFVFPAAMTGGSLAFPIRYRGLATTLMLTMFDVGNLVGQPAVGSVLTLARKADLPAYPTMFTGVAVFMTVVAIYFATRTTVASAASVPQSREERILAQSPEGLR